MQQIMKSDRSRFRKAEALRALHAGDDVLLLPNIWNPIGARILEEKGFPAVATASAAVSASLGYADGERISRATLLEIVGRIARSVQVPVTADVENGYADTLDGLEETARLVIDAGVAGINLEDSPAEGGPLRSVGEQCERIAAVRDAATRTGVPLVINARIDSFLSSDSPDSTAAVEEAVERAAAYARAGADCVYPIGPGDEPTLRTLRQRISCPINVLVAPGAAPVPLLRDIGINRVSFGPYVFRSCLQHLASTLDALGRQEGYESLGGMMSGGEVRRFVSSEPEPTD